MDSADASKPRLDSWCSTLSKIGFRYTLGGGRGEREREREERERERGGSHASTRRATNPGWRHVACKVAQFAIQGRGKTREPYHSAIGNVVRTK
jgi:hypothetical protein